MVVNLAVSPVNDPPIISGGEGLLELSIPEDTSLAYDLNGSDPDLSDLLTWEVLVTPSNGSLSVDPSTGILLYQPNQDYNGSDQFSIGLNDGVEQVAVQFQIQVTGVNDPPSSISFSDDLNFSENSPVGTLVATLAVSDPDPGDQHGFEIVTSGESAGLFSVDANGSLLTADLFDFESNASEFQIQVRATDNFGSFTEANLLISLLNIVEDLDGDGTEDAYDSDLDGDGFDNLMETEYGSDPYDLSLIHI